MTGKEAALKLTLHHMQCGMLMPIEWVKQNGEGSELSEVFRMAISALREQVNVVEIDQFKGCKYCTNEENDIPLPTDVSYTWVSGNKLQNAYGECKIKFCPMCGRRLEEV